MKKFFIILAGILALFVVLIITVPLLFKKQIKEKVESEINKQIEAKVFFDEKKFSLSLIRNFPNLSVSLGDFGVVGIKDFEGDTLASIGAFNLTVDIMSVIKGEQIKVLGLTLDKPRIKAKVNKDGLANWDIAKKDTTAKEEEPKEEEPSSFSLKIKKWEIKKGYVSFDDYTSQTHAEVINLNHSGKGNITSTVYDLVTKTTIDAISAKVGNSTYLNKAQIDFDVAINIDNEQSKYTFKENSFKINDFTLKIDGYYSMPDTAFSEMDLKFSTPQTSFKSLLSLVPAVFLSDFDKIKTEGEFSFSGFAKGKQSATELPQFGLKLNVEKAMFKYPDLPTPVSNIAIDLFVENKDVIDNLYVNLKKFHMDLGTNPIDATLEMKGLTKMDLNANVLAKLNLEELTKIFPIEGTELKGNFGLNANAKGIYEAASNTMPAVQANMTLNKGYAKSKDFPSAIENIEMKGSAQNSTGQMKDMKIDIAQFAFVMDQQPFDLKLHLENLENYKWDFSAKGIIDLGKIFKIFPIEGTTMNGIVNVNDFNTKGVYADVTAGRFDKLPTSGSMNFQNFEYFESTLLPQGFKMTTGTLNFDPQKLKIENLKGFLGKSDIAIDGYVANYIPFVFSDGVVKGEMKFVSSQFDVNEFMPKADPNAPKPEQSPEEVPSTVEVVEVPKAFDFVLSSDIKKVLYDNLVIENLVGDIIVKDGTLRMRGVNFNLLDGFFKTNMTYDTKEISKPTFDFDLNIQNLDCQRAYATFNTVKKLAPVAEKIEGKFSTDFKMAGILKKDMSPDYSTMNGKGTIYINDAKLKNLTLLNKIGEMTKRGDMSEVPLQNMKVNAEVKNGRVHVEPFDIKNGNTSTNISGSQGIDGTLDYFLKTDMPAGVAGEAVNSALSSLVGGPVVGDRIKINFKVTGTSSNPKITPMGAESSGGKTLKDAATDRAKDELNKQKEEAERKLREEQDRLKREGEQRLREEQDRLRLEAERKKREEEERLKQKAKEEAEKLKQKIKFP